MKKIKVLKNEKTILFSFSANILNGNILFELCNELQLSDIFIDVFGVSKRRLSFSKVVATRSNTLLLSQTINSDSWSIKATVNDLPILVGILSEFNIDELNIWDNYISWEEYLKTANYKIPILKPVKLEDKSKVYLNYNLHESNKIELYLDLSYDVEKIHQKLNELINIM